MRRTPGGSADGPPAPREAPILHIRGQKSTPVLCYNAPLVPGGRTAPMSEYDFLFKPFAEMTPDDYAAVGFRSGLEIHQQLLTAKKLFCRCPAGRYSDALRRRDPPPHAADPVRARRVRRHGPDGVQDPQGDHLPDQPGDGLHLRDGRHAAVHDRRAGPRPAPSASPCSTASTSSTSSTSPASSTSTAASRPASSARPSSASTAPSPTRTAASPSSSSASRRTPAARSATSATAART
ncbi:MAG: hypothetical protein MZU84_06115 [Sphingobacterium sp.]|nr:hypothetical protein [Sphingobacterium sp.]